MQIILIIYQWVKNLFGIGNVLTYILGIILLVLLIGLAVIAIIIDVGIKIFSIFWDETLYYSSRVYDSLNGIAAMLLIVAVFLMYYLERLLNFLIPSYKIKSDKIVLDRDLV